MAILMGRALADAARMFVQGLAMILLAMALGVRFVHGPLGVLAALLLAVIFGIGLAALSNVAALRTKSTEATLMIVNFFLFPLLFLSPALVPKDVLPGWIATFGKFNPVAYAVDASPQPHGRRRREPGAVDGDRLGTARPGNRVPGRRRDRRDDARADGVPEGDGVARTLLGRQALDRAPR